MAYASLDELTERLGRTLDEAEELMAEAALEDATALAMEYGREWPEDDPPRLVKTLVLRSVRRYMENPDGFTTSRAGDETVQWSDAHGRDAGSVYFTRDEQALLKGLAGRTPGLMSASVSAWGPQRPLPRDVTAGYVPAAGMPHSEIPYFAHPTEPW
ncbi:hypothetical protein [Actinoplanes sp. NPDC026670]|uniref:hypothetical protein n=1 Tax=Actinoplanes sp. NPDC026670 TaxID=3154700 RepID=UPI0033E49EDE